MNRDITCIARLIIDSLPLKIRNSHWLFKLLAYLLSENKFLFYFREFYDKNKNFDLALLYMNGSPYYSKPFSATTDCNSIHQRLLKDLLTKLNPSSIIDVGCGSGYLLRRMHGYLPDTTLVGVDLSAPTSRTCENLSFHTCEISAYLSSLSTNYFEVAVASHVIEHLRDPIALINDMRRITSVAFIILVPLEKKYRWGLNYHVQFFETKKKFLQLAVSPTSKKYLTYSALGDLLYIEYI